MAFVAAWMTYNTNLKLNDATLGHEIEVLDPDLLREICKYRDLINIRSDGGSAAFVFFVKVVASGELFQIKEV